MASAAREFKDRGTELLLKGKVAAALEQFRKAVDADPQDTTARRKVAEALVRLGKQSAAIDEYQALAGMLAVKGRLLDATAISKVILALDPAHTETQQVLAQFVARQPKESWKAKLSKPMAAHLVPPPPPSGEVEMTGAPIPSLPSLPREAMSELLGGIQVRSVRAGERIFQEGDRGEAMFVVIEGSLEGMHQGAIFERLGPGGVFGEISVLVGVPRLVTVRATEPSLLVEIPSLAFQLIGQKYPQLREVVQGFFKMRLTEGVTRINPLFQGFTTDELARIAAKFELREAKAGDELIRNGEDGKGLWLILRGRCAAYGESGAKYGELHEGALFGVMALLGRVPPAGAIRAESACVLLFLDRDSFAREVANNPVAAKALEGLARDRLIEIERMQRAIDAAMV